MYDFKNSNGFLLWLNQIRTCLAVNKYPSNEELYLDLIKQEELWRKLLLTTDEGKDIYKKFINYILLDRKNILDARPYFRVRQSDFLVKVNPFIKNKNSEPLSLLRINFTFITWALNNLSEIPIKRDLIIIYQRIMKLRNDFLIKNSPLLINRMKLIYSSYSFLYKDMQELISISSNAALVALDKFVPIIDEITGEEKYTSVLLSSIIGRINAAAIQDNINNKIHMYPKDRKILSSLRKMKNSGFSKEEICEVMNISESEMERLTNSGHMVSLEDIHNYQIESDDEPEDNFERADLFAKMNRQVNTLSVLEKKILHLKGLL